MGQASFHGGYGQVMSMGQLGQPQQRPMGANLGAALGMPPRYSSVDSSQLQNVSGCCLWHNFRSPSVEHYSAKTGWSILVGRCTTNTNSLLTVAEVW